MDLKGIITITGQKGLFKHISQAKNGIIVESLEDKRRIPAYSSYKISALEDIAIFTTDGEVPLSDIFKSMYLKHNGEPCLDPKSSNDDLKNYFAEVLPEYDRERVYVSHIKHVLTWYNQLQKLGLLTYEEETKVEEPVAAFETVSETKSTVNEEVETKTELKQENDNLPEVENNLEAHTEQKQENDNLPGIENNLETHVEQKQENDNLSEVENKSETQTEKTEAKTKQKPATQAKQEPAPLSLF